MTEKKKNKAITYRTMTAQFVATMCAATIFTIGGLARGAEVAGPAEQSFSAPKPPPQHFESFEKPESLASWGVDGGGTISLDREYAKDGAQSAKWSFVRGSRLQMAPFTACANIEKPQLGGIRLWIYCRRPVDDVLTFRIGEMSELAEGQPRYAFTFSLNFSGWRALWINRFDRSARQPNFKGKKIPDTLEVLAPASLAEGELWFDNFQTDDGPEFRLTADWQMPSLAEGESGSEYRISQLKPEKTTLPPLTLEQRRDLASIAQKVDDFFFPAGVEYEQLNTAS